MPEVLEERPTTSPEAKTAKGLTPDPHGIGGKVRAMHDAGVQPLPDGIEDTVKGLPGPVGPFGPTTTLGAAKTEPDGTRKILVDLNRPSHPDDKPHDIAFAWVPQPNSVKEATEETEELQKLENLVEWADTQKIFSADPLERLEALSTLDAVEFSKTLLIIHQMIAPQVEPSPHPTPANMYQNGKRTETLMDPEERLTFLEGSCRLANQVAQKAIKEAGGNPDATKRALIRISNVLGLSTVITHPFIDANGRTSRVIALLTKGGVPEDEKANRNLLVDLVIVAKNRPGFGEGYSISSFMPTYPSDDQNEKWRKSIEAAASINLPLTENGQRRYDDIKHRTFTSPFRSTVLD